MKTNLPSLVLAKTFRRDSRFRRAVALAAVFSFSVNVLANPTGLTVQSGRATLTINGSQLTINAGNNAVLNWQSFNIGAGETTIFNQPSATSIVWNQINNQSASQIYGSLHANGIVVLLNSSGFYFGPNSFVSAAGLVVSTANCLPPQNSGGSWQFNGPPPLASIVNFGTIQVGKGGSAYLIADQVENHGTIAAPAGSIGLAAGQTVTLSERPDGRGMSMNVTLPQGSVDNYGNLVADGGTIALNAKVVNQNGLLQANSVRDQNGVIELVASDSLNLGATSQILAQGDNSAAGSAGGNVTLKSGNTFSDTTGSSIVTAGGVNGGNGGNVEISAPNVESLNTAMNAGAAAGFSGGSFLFDPVNIILGTSTAGGAINVNTAFAGFSSIQLQASGNITIASGTIWDLSESTGQTAGLVTLQAGGNIIFNNNALITDANNWSLNLMAGVSFPSGTVQSGVGNIYLNGSAGGTVNGAIQLAQGNVNLSAGNNITVGRGYVRTVGGGSITVNALAGSVNTGTWAKGYNFLDAKSGAIYSPDPNLGGISTYAGGDVNITAGLDVVSLLPNANSPAGDAGCGAFGSEAGNVTITAGRDVMGHYVVANGTGTLTAGHNAGNSTIAGQLALSLINGGWNVTAGQDINLSEVRNPNGILNQDGEIQSADHPYLDYHYFDYGAGDYVTLNAGNAVVLGGGSLPRNSSAIEKAIPSIYPGILNITAGAGGVTLDNNVILFPSPLGSLSITTTGGGSLIGNSASLVNLIVSDSGNVQYKSSFTFGLTDHAAVPVHLNSATPITLNIAGDFNNIQLAAPEAAQLTVGGNMNNSRLLGQNLHAGDVTSINVAGDIVNRNDFTDATISYAPQLNLLAEANTDTVGLSFYTSLEHQLHFTPDPNNPNAGTLTFQGKMTSDQLAALTSLTILTGVDNSGNPILKTVQILDAATAKALYAGSQNIPTSAITTGYLIGGGGTLDITAHNLDLGTTLGIQSVGPLKNSTLANYFTHGADINVNLTGNLDMFSTAICSLNGGDISVFAAGDINVGSSFFTGNDYQQARGIFTVAKSDVSVIAGGDITVDGSRIAAFDGGNVTVESLTGNINAGTAGIGFVSGDEITVDGHLDPFTGLPYHEDKESIPGSGIVTTTFLMSKNSVGNILVETPNGTINTGVGGIIQLPSNNKGSLLSIVEVLTGLELHDVNGKALTAGQLGQPTIQGNLAAAAAGDAPDTVVVKNGSNSTKVQVSAAVWARLVASLNLSPAANQNLELDLLGGSQTALQTALTGTGSGLADYNFAAFGSANRTIDARGSGIIGNNVRLLATGDILGVIFARNNISLASVGQTSVSALGKSIDAVAGSFGGSTTLIGTESVNATGADPGQIQSQDANGGGNSFAQGTAANAASAAMSSEAATTPAVADTGTGDDDSAKKKKGIALVQKVSRVTVILPPKKLSETATANHSL